MPGGAFFTAYDYVEYLWCEVVMLVSTSMYQPDSKVGTFQREVGGGKLT